jgi:hypothetical protein
MLAKSHAALRVAIEVERDRSFAAQASAYGLAHMLSRRGHRVSVLHAGVGPDEASGDEGGRGLDLDPVPG